MHFTREPIIETIITPREGYKLCVRNSKQSHAEEYFVDSLQVISLGEGCFYRSLEKPKPFLVPAADYEVLEVRETKMALKIPASEKGGIKIGGGRESAMKAAPREEKEEMPVQESAGEQREQRPNKREKKRFRKRRDRFEKEAPSGEASEEGGERAEDQLREEKPSMIIPPPTTLISETISRYKNIPGFASVFFEKEAEAAIEESEAEEASLPSIPDEDM